MHRAALLRVGSGCAVLRWERDFSFFPLFGRACGKGSRLGWRAGSQTGLFIAFLWYCFAYCLEEIFKKKIIETEKGNC